MQTIVRVGVDIAKNVLQVHAVDGPRQSGYQPSHSAQ